ncbi:pyruvate kinase [Buchnera aphidicola (Chaitoregma tattakana)]|uniref:pyruvate kinase n=1 Tax=Buchnera aphidicola TaxID=9 RepID=UPI0031B82976
MFNMLKRTKIIATMGPATSNIQILEKMIINGVNVFRLNFSHGNNTEHLKLIKMLFYLRRKTNCNIGILGDLQGPKIRISKFFKHKVFLKKNSIFTLDYSLKNKHGNEHKVGFNYKNLYKDVSIGDTLLLDDGKISLEVKFIRPYKIFTKVITGGLLLNNKGINKLGGGLSAQSLTSKDKQDIIFSSKMQLDYLAVSFPKSYKDINIVRNLVNAYRAKIKIIAKIERAEVVNNSVVMNKIIASSDAVMVARGDLGVEICNSELAIAQKKIIKNSMKLNKVIITATQMMESMIVEPNPTRAEVMDISNAILDGTDAVMLSAETASGKYPLETVFQMNKICIGTEKIFKQKFFKAILKKEKDINETISSSAIYIANNIKYVSAVATISESENAFLISSRTFSKTPIFSFSNNKKVLNYISLYKSIVPIYLKKKYYKVHLEKKVIKILLKKKFVKKRDLIVIFKSGFGLKEDQRFSIKILKV